MKNLFDYFVILLPSGTYFTKQITVTHRNTFISHIIYLEFAFTPVCIVSDRRLFVHKGNLSCMSELRFSRNHNYVTAILKIDYRAFQNLLDLGLEYCYRLLKSSKYRRNIRFWQRVIRDLRNCKDCECYKVLIGQCVNSQYNINDEYINK